HGAPPSWRGRGPKARRRPLGRSAASPTAKPSFAVDHLADDPTSLIADQPGDQPRRIVRLAEPAGGELSLNGLNDLERTITTDLVQVTGVDRARIDGVENDPLLDETVGDRGGDPGQRGLGGGVGDLVTHRAQLLAGGHPDDATAGPSVVLGRERLGRQQGGAGVDLPVPIQEVSAELTELAVTAAAGVIAHQ